MSAIDISALGASPGERAYRAYRLTASGSIEGVEHIDVSGDELAVGLAAMIANNHGIDLWERSRFLGSFPPLHVGATGAKA